MRRQATLVLPLLLLGPGLARAEEPTRVWVFFTDHGRTPTQLAAELSLREAELGPRTLARRSKVRHGELVDARDLLPARAYVNAIERSGARLRVQSRWLNAVSIDADPETQREIAALPFVRRLHPVARSHRRTLDVTHVPLQANPEDYGVTWEQLSLIGVPDLHDCGLTGEGVIVGVQDIGFSLAHQALENAQVLATYDFVNDEEEVGPPPAGIMSEDFYHGTFVLATIAGHAPGNYLGVAPDVAVILSETEDLSTEEPFEEDNYVEGLEWIEGLGADIFTSSLSYFAWYDFEDYDGATAVTTIAVQIAVDNGLIVFVPMGNDGPEPSTLVPPADAEGAISVGSVDLMGQLSSFSSRGPTADGRIKPDLVAPGEDVFTVKATELDKYGVQSGTSLSTPITAGVAALLLEAYPWLTPAEMAELLRSTASRADAPDSDWGYGLIDASAAAQMCCSSADGDADGHLACAGDCDDANAAIHPGASEACDNTVDDDCDELIDELDPDCMTGDGDGDGDGDPGDGDGDGDSGTETESDESDGDSGTPPAIDETSGCACATTNGPRPNPAPLALLVLLGIERRRLCLHRRTTSPAATIWEDHFAHTSNRSEIVAMDRRVT